MTDTLPDDITSSNILKSQPSESVRKYYPYTNFVSPKFLLLIPILGVCAHQPTAMELNFCIDEP